MRREFHPILHALMKADPKIRVLLPDLGYRMFDQMHADWPHRVTTLGASEQLAVGAAVGLTYMGLIPIVYSITPFLLWRPAEWLRVYLNHEGAPVKLLASGRGSSDHSQEDYRTNGFTHYAGDDRALLSILPNIRGFWPETVADLEGMTREWIYHPGPAYMNLRR